MNDVILTESTKLIRPGKLHYSSNNSGGNWWLSDDDWLALENAGWEVEWKRDRPDVFGKPYPDGRWLGALATEASKEFFTAEEGVEEWERLTNNSSTDEGCNCCGQPHEFSWTDADGDTRSMWLETRSKSYWA